MVNLGNLGNKKDEKKIEKKFQVCNQIFIIIYFCIFYSVIKYLDFSFKLIVDEYVYLFIFTYCN